MSRSWKQQNTRDRKVYLGLHTPLQVNNITTSGTTEFNTNEQLYIDLSGKLLTVAPYSSFPSVTFNKESKNTVSVNSDASFQGSIHGADASFERIGASGGNGGVLKIVNDVSFHGSIHGVGASFHSIGASVGNILKITNDVSFQGSVHGTDASFQNIGASDGNMLKIVDDVSFQGSLHCVDASFQNIGASDGNILKIVNDVVSFQGSIACTDVSFQRIGTINGLSLEVVNDVSFVGSLVANQASFASVTPYSTNKIKFTDTKFDFSNNTKHALISDVMNFLTGGTNSKNIS
jgi:hypothetical protein